MNREEILDRYRRLRPISTHHHSAALKFLSGPALLAHAKRLGLAVGRTLLADSEEEMILTFDLALYTAKDGRSRPLDRYARAARLAPGSDEARMLDAMRAARFSIWRIEQPHPTAGLIRRASRSRPDRGGHARHARLAARRSRASCPGPAFRHCRLPRGHRQRHVGGIAYV